MSTTSTISIQGSLIRKLLGYCDQRFPIVPYSVLVLLFFGSALAVFQTDVVFDKTWLGAIVMWLTFFHLRIFDEFKDFHQDRFTHPERLLSQGIVTLSILGRIGMAAIFLQGVIAAVISWPAFGCWSIAFVFSLLMRIEFGIGAWLEKRMLLYAITHNPIVAALGFFAWGCSGADWDWRYLWYLGAISVGSFAFEIGRKTNQPEEETSGVDSYSSVYGLSRALIILKISVLVATIGAGVTLWLFGETMNYLIAEGILFLAVLSFIVLVKGTATAKKIELGATLFLLLMMLSIGVGTW